MVLGADDEIYKIQPPKQPLLELELHGKEWTHAVAQETKSDDRDETSHLQGWEEAQYTVQGHSFLQKGRIQPLLSIALSSTRWK